MEREDQLRYCKVCENQKFDADKGIICSITNSPASFTESCTLFSPDPVLKSQFESQKQSNHIQQNLAGLGRRLANNLLDSFFFLIFVYIIAVFWGTYRITAGNDISELQSGDNLLIFRASVYIIFYLYYLLFEAITGRTLGKLITGTKVVNEFGEKPDIKTIAIRTICRFIPFEVFSYFGDEPTGWHDRLSKTYVVKITN